MNSKSPVQSDSIYARLDQIQVHDHERLRARASLERAEAIATLLVAATDAVIRLCHSLVVRPIQRLTSALG